MHNVAYLNNHLPQLLPQQPPFVFIDRILELGNDELETAYLIKPDSLFLIKNTFQPAGIVESMAQSAAIYVGVQAITKYEGDDNKQPPIGYIASISDLNILTLPVINQEIRMVSNISNQIGSSLIIHCKTYAVESLIAEARLQLFLTEQ